MISEIWYIVLAILAFIIGYIVGRALTVAKERYRLFKTLPKIRKQAINQSRSVLAGQFSEQLAPFLPKFPFNPNEVRFLGKPIDFVVFSGMDESNINEIVFVEVKSGNAKLNASQQKVKEAVEKGKIRWFEYRVPSKLTRTFK